MVSAKRHIISEHLFIVLATGLISCGVSDEIKQYAATETYPNDTKLESVTEKKALIVVAHDDDMCAMSGTMSKLNNNGWEIGIVSFSQTPERDNAQIQACKNILDTVFFVQLKPEQIRNDNENSKPRYSAFPKANFNTVFNIKTIEKNYLEIIRNFNPAVIFTLDNEIGAYGHPEHVLISQMVLDWAEKKIIHPQYIYQSVYTPHMQESIMQRHSERMKSWGYPSDEWEKAKKTYGIQGLPMPDVQINITSEAEQKMAYLRSYNERERKTIGFYVPEFEKYPAEKYFAVFDREFYRVFSYQK